MMELLVGAMSNSPEIRDHYERTEPWDGETECSFLSIAGLHGRYVPLLVSLW
jgi:hypothetical protein